MSTFRLLLPPLPPIYLEKLHLVMCSVLYYFVAEVIRRKILVVGNEPEGSENARVVNDVGYADIVDFLVSHEGGTGVTSHFPGKKDVWQRLVLRSIIWSCQSPIRYIGIYVLTYVQSYTLLAFIS